MVSMRIHVATWDPEGSHAWEVVTVYASIGGHWETVEWSIRCPADHDPPHVLRREDRDAAPMTADPEYVVEPAWGGVVVPPDIADPGADGLQVFEDPFPE